MKNTLYYAWLFALLLIANTTFAQQPQSHLWSLPNQQVNMTLNVGQFSPLPAPGPNYQWPDYYDGRAAENGHNAMHDENGDLLFFIIDSYIFDKNGYQITVFEDENASELSTLDEVVIIPVPGNCNQYYIVMGEFSPYVYKLDLSIPNVNSPATYPGLFGELLDASGNITASSPYAILSQGNPSSGLFSFVNISHTFGLVAAVTTLRPDNTRYLFCGTGDGFATYLISNSGITYVNHMLYASDLPGNFFLRGEAEVVTLPNGNYRVAFVAVGTDFSTPYTQHNSIFLYDLNSNAQVVNFNNIKYYIDPVTNEEVYIRGIEFSPNMQYLYVTHSSTTNLPAGVDVYNVAGGTPIQLFSNLAGSSNYGLSNLELGYDGQIYAVNSTGFGLITTPDAPNANMFTANAISFNFNYTASSNVFMSTGGASVYILPDQIDGEDYTAVYSDSTLCCKRLDGYEVSYTALQGTSVWNANGANPFNAVQEVRIDDELLFPSGSTVYIYNMTFRFEENARMTIEKGAKVYINNTLLTSNECDGVMWQGVSVHGNPNMSHAFTNSSQRGFLNMTNNSEISNAKIGVTLHKRFINGSVDWSNRGGIVTASNSTFRNNTKDVAFLTYDFKNRSTFSNCEFLTTDQLNDGSILTEHVSMFKVRGVQFKGCDFKNTTPNGQFYTDQYRGAGISSIQAYYKVIYNCNTYAPPGTTCTNKDRGSFEGLYYGIYALGVNAANSIEVKYNDFTNNTRGAYFGAIDDVIFVNNYINVGAPIGWSYGAYFENSTGYKIQNNDFETSHTGRTFGLVIANSNNNQTLEEANEVYRNTFADFDYGAVAVRGNVARSVNGTANVINGTGLTYKCNRFSGSKINDIGFLKGINDQQGVCSLDSKKLANNVFSLPTPTNGDFWNYDNAQYNNNSLYYTYYAAAAFNSTDNTIPQMTNGINGNNNTQVINCSTVFNETQGCPVNRFDVSGKKLLSGKISIFKQQAATIKSFLAEVDEEVMEETVDVQEEIAEHGVNDFDEWEDFAEDLIEQSPFVKDSDLVALFNLPIPGGVLKEILLANSTLPKTVLNVLAASLYSQSIKNQINNAQNGGINARIQKENEILYLQREQSLYFEEIIREFIHDTTIVGGLDSAIVLLKGRNTDADACRLVGFYIDTKQYAKAQEQLNFLRLKDPVKYDGFCKFYELLLSFEQTVSNCYVVKTDSVRKAQLEAFAAGGLENKVCYRAQALLNEVYKTKYFEQEPIFPIVKSAMMVSEPVVENRLASKMSIYPNPANTILTVELLLETEEIAKVTLYDAMGRVALNKQVTNLKSYMDVSGLENGIYILIVELPNGEKLTDKVMIRR